MVVIRESLRPICFQNSMRILEKKSHSTGSTDTYFKIFQLSHYNIGGLTLFFIFVFDCFSVHWHDHVLLYWYFFDDLRIGKIEQKVGLFQWLNIMHLKSQTFDSTILTNPVFLFHALKTGTISKNTIRCVEISQISTRLTTISIRDVRLRNIRS